MGAEMVRSPFHQILFRIVGGWFSCLVMLDLCPALRGQFIYLGRNHFSPPYWVPDKFPFLLALSHTRMGRDTVQVLEVCHYLLRSPAPGQNPMCIFQTWFIRNYKACLAGLMGRSSPSHTRPNALLMHYSCLEEGAAKDLVLLVPTPTSHAHTRFYIPHPDVSIQIPPYWGPWLRHFSTFTQYFSTTNLSLSLPPPGPRVYPEVGAFCSGLFDSEMISPICTAFAWKVKYVH